VTFDIDANGILNVTALDKATNRSQHITITASSGLSESEVQRMKQEAEAHADEDKKRKELVEVKNIADNSVYSAEKLVKENGDKIPAEVKKEVEESAAKVKEVLAGDNADAIKSATEALQQVIQKVGASMYQQQQAPAGEAPTGGDAGSQAEGTAGEGGAAPGENPGDVVDGEFKNI
jgi:molecular chaperone DnaK